jgi:N-acetylglucosaminyldiphosphoundecaprenol N-acetyl-beta-D-mannosaminyltransferase
MKTVRMFGISLVAVTLGEASEWLSIMAQKKETRLIFTANTEAIVLMRSNEEFRNAYSAADYALADGMPLVWFSRLIGDRLPERVTGSDLLPELCRMAEKKSLKVFFLGGTPEVTPKAVENLLKRFPALQVVGMATPWINLSDSESVSSDLIESVNRSEPDIVFIGFGAPKQEIWLGRNNERLKTGIIVTVGGTFDFLAGKTVRAPLWMQKSGLEWLWRLLHEPKRLWRRYLIGNARFLVIAWREWRKPGTFCDSRDL